MLWSLNASAISSVLNMFFRRKCSKWFAPQQIINTIIIETKVSALAHVSQISVFTICDWTNICSIFRTQNRHQEWEYWTLDLNGQTRHIQFYTKKLFHWHCCYYSTVIAVKNQKLRSLHWQRSINPYFIRSPLCSFIWLLMIDISFLVTQISTLPSTRVSFWLESEITTKHQTFSNKLKSQFDCSNFYYLEIWQLMTKHEMKAMQIFYHVQRDAKWQQSMLLFDMWIEWEKMFWLSYRLMESI